MKDGISLNSTDIEDRTPLSWAAESRQIRLRTTLFQLHFSLPFLFYYLYLPRVCMHVCLLHAPF